MKSCPSIIRKKGLTLIELLVVVAILAILILAAFFAFSLQLSKARDAKRKADLKKAQTALEDCYNELRLYPDPTDLSDSITADGGILCGKEYSACFPVMPCDPMNGDRYRYLYVTDSTRKWYKIFATLENENDTAIADTGCSGGCGPGNSYSYVVTSPNISVCKLPNKPPIGPNGKCIPSSPCMLCPSAMVCMPSGDCCRPRHEGECL